MKLRTLALAACIAVTLAACVTPRSSTHAYEADLAAITAFNSQYLKAINDGDRAALSALTDDDHIMIVPNGQPVVG